MIHMYMYMCINKYSLFLFSIFFNKIDLICNSDIFRFKSKTMNIKLYTFQIIHLLYRSTTIAVTYDILTTRM